MSNAAPSTVRLALVGDVHGCWDPVRDILALQHLQPDIILFVGDFGEENVELVGHISRVKGAVEGAKVGVILGNHDAWYSLHAKGQRSSSRNKPQNKKAQSKAQQGTHHNEGQDVIDAQLHLLGDCHIGYKRVDFPDWNLSILGARPFSFGPASWPSSFYSSRYGVQTIEESSKRIVECALGGIPMEQLQHHSFIVVGHNGPSGLGSQPHDICGRDFESRGQMLPTDFGDNDLAISILTLQRAGLHIPLTIFGHMHHRIKGGGLRKMLTTASPLLSPSAAVERSSEALLRENPTLSELASRRQKGISLETDAEEEVAGNLGDRGILGEMGSMGNMARGRPPTECGSVMEGAGGAGTEGGGEDRPREATVHVNAAVVPRIRQRRRAHGRQKVHQHHAGAAPKSGAAPQAAPESGAAPEAQGLGLGLGRRGMGSCVLRHSTEHHFVVVEMDASRGSVDMVEDVWVHVGCGCHHLEHSLEHLKHNNLEHTRGSPSGGLGASKGLGESERAGVLGGLGNSERVGALGHFGESERVGAVGQGSERTGILGQLEAVRELRGTGVGVLEEMCFEKVELGCRERRYQAGEVAENGGFVYSAA